MIRTTNIRNGRIDVINNRFVEEAVFNKWTRRARLKKNDIILSREAPLGEVGLLRSDGKLFLGQRTMLYRVNPEKVDQNYLFYQMVGPYVQAVIQAKGSGSTVAHLRVPDAETLPIPIAPLPTQRKIAAILIAYDDLIETNKRRIALLETMAEELYREWFVRMRFPGYQNTKFVKGVPEGWPQKRFGEFCMLKRGYDLPDALVEPGQYPVIASTSIKTFHKLFKAEPPVITTGRSGSLGQVLMTHSRAWPLNTTLYVLDFLGNSAYLTFYMLKNMGLEGFNSGAGVPTLNRNHLNGLPVFVPEPNLQKEFDCIIEPLHQQAENLRQSNVNLIQNRDLLLPRLISGKLPVEDLDIHFPPSMREELAHSLPE